MATVWMVLPAVVMEVVAANVSRALKALSVLGLMGCEGISAELSWKDGDNKDRVFGGRGGDDCGGGSLDGESATG